MPLDLMNIINNKLYKFKYITAAFFVVFFYTYYRLFIYLQDKNYIMLILYFSLLLLLYNKFNKFSYFICFIALILIQIFNIDNLLKNKIIENIENVQNDQNVQVGTNGETTTMDTIQKRSKAKGDTLNTTAENTKTSNTENNPCENYIRNRLLKSGVKPSTSDYTTNKKKDDPAQQIVDIMPQGPIILPKPLTFQ